LLLLLLILQLLLFLLFRFLGPHKAVAVEPAGIARRAAGMDARRVARDIGCPVRNTPLAERIPTASAGGTRRPGCAFFWLLYLCTSKEK